MTTQITLPPTAPSRADRDTFAARADAWVSWEENNLVPEMNTALTEINSNAEIAAMGADAATVAIASANFKGEWSTLTGALAIPASVFHNGAFWILLSNIADVTTKVPGVASEWALIKTTNALPWFIASGSIAQGGPVAINSDGTVSAPAITAAAAGVSVDYSPASGSAAICYAEDQNKIVLAAASGATLTAKVGTLAGETVSWGTASSSIGSAETNKIGICAVGSGKVVVVHAPSSKVLATVGAISGTTITFGTPVQIVATASSWVGRYSVTFDPDTGSVVVVYQNGTGNSFAIAGSVSGATIAFGTPVDVGAIGQSAQCVAMPGTGGKVFLAYTESSAYKARILSLVGTAITANAAYTWGAVGTSGVPMRAAFDPVSRKLLVVGCATSGNVGVAAVVSVALTECFFGSSRTFSSAGVTASVDGLFVYWDVGIGAPIIIYADAGNSGYGTMMGGSIASGTFSQISKSVFLSALLKHAQAVRYGATQQAVCVYGDDTKYSVVTPYSTTACNFIGFAQSSASTNEYLKVSTSQYVDENQTGLTVSAKYYIADNGALTRTVTETFAGTAVGATRLLIKG